MNTNWIAAVDTWVRSIQIPPRDSRACRRAQAFCATSLWLAAVMLAVSAAVNASEDSGSSEGGYRLGSGWRVPHTDLSIGGYGSVALTRLEDQPWTLDANHLSMFLWHDGPSRLRFFSEVELEDGVEIQAKRATTNDHFLAVERLYGDWSQSDALNFRAGKFLTPIGRWNVIHADPLVWTTSRPLLTERLFPTNATGGAVFGSVSGIGEGLDYTVFGSGEAEFRHNPKQDSYREAYGLHLSYALSALTRIGLSASSFETVRAEPARKNLLGFDAIWADRGYELSAEAVYRASARLGAAPDAKGLYLQAALPLADRLFAVGRYEYYQQPGAAPGLHLWLGGLNYRVHSAVMLKAEFSRAVDNHIDAPDGFRSSIAVLF